ncbi:hypothetical protein [Fusobacterium hominis]|uniref:COG1470 family protein n=1 Tax=Fusobacterium hominis TaxID=2764326 RepID=UPI0022DF23CD|nr:hypothetical protein [Fusobacterium hominis]
MKKIKLLLLFVTFSIVAYSINFSVSPTKFDIDMVRKKTYELEIVNNTGNILRITTYLEQIAGYRSLEENIVVFPKKISIKPGGKKEIRFTIKNLERLEPGIYKNLLVIREIETSNTQNIKFVHNKDLIFNMNIITEVALHINGVKNKEE